MSGTLTDRERPELPGHVTAPLLDRIVAQSLDSDYRDAAERRRVEGDPPSARPDAAGGRTGEAPQQRRHRRIGPRTMAVLALFGVLLAVAAVQTSRDAPENASSKQALIDQIHRAQDAAEAQQAQRQALRTDTLEEQQRLTTISADADAAQRDITTLAASAGFAPVTGPGLRLTVDDADGGGDEGRVRDEDLAKLIDGLWSAGAEAITVDGWRLTALTAVRTSGIAIHIGTHPISPPYVVAAIGDPQSLAADFAETAHGRAWYDLVSAFGFRFTVEKDDRLDLPAASPPVLRDARAPDPDAN